MDKRALAALAAAAAAIPAAALAQPAGHPQAGHSWQERGPPGHVRLHPGGRIHPYWFRPQFHVQNWALYGFSAPRAEQRWVRHYDDAYLVDRDGVVLDGRYGLDWDRYGERWAMDEGIPRYVGEGAYEPEERDYAWVDGHGRQPAYAGPPVRHEAPYPDERWEEEYGHAEPYPAPEPPCRSARTPCGPAPAYGYSQRSHGYAQPGYGYGYPGYYGCGGCGTVVTIVETTVTPVTTRYVVTEEVVEEVVYTRRPYRSKRKVRRTPPPAGERG